MALEMKGLDNILAKLDKLNSLHLKEAIQTVEDETIREIKNGASFAPKASQYIGRCKVRQDKHYYYLDIGLSKEKGDFDKWKNLYYHNYGYHDKGLNLKDSNIYIDMHKQWFNQTVNTLSPKIKRKIKEQLENEIRNICK